MTFPSSDRCVNVSILSSARGRCKVTYRTQQNHNHTPATGPTESRSRLHELLFHIRSNFVVLSTSPSLLAFVRKTLLTSCMSCPLHSPIKNLWRWEQVVTFILTLFHPSSSVLALKHPQYLFLPAQNRYSYTCILHLHMSDRTQYDEQLTTRPYSLYAAKWPNAQLFLQPKEKFIHK
jgi:hypothetical protein